MTAWSEDLILFWIDISMANNAYYDNLMTFKIWLLLIKEKLDGGSDWVVNHLNLQLNWIHTIQYPQTSQKVKF